MQLISTRAVGPGHHLGRKPLTKAITVGRFIGAAGEETEEEKEGEEKEREEEEEEEEGGGDEEERACSRVLARI